MSGSLAGSRRGMRSDLIVACALTLWRESGRSMDKCQDCVRQGLAAAVAPLGTTCMSFSAPQSMNKLSRSKGCDSMILSRQAGSSLMRLSCTRAS